MSATMTDKHGNLTRITADRYGRLWAQSARGHLSAARNLVAEAAQMRTPLRRQRELLSQAEIEAGVAASFARSAGEAQLASEAASLREIAMSALVALRS